MVKYLTKGNQDYQDIYGWPGTGFLLILEHPTVMLKTVVLENKVKERETYVKEMSRVCLQVSLLWIVGKNWNKRKSRLCV